MKALEEPSIQQTADGEAQPSLGRARSRLIRSSNLELKPVVQSHGCRSCQQIGGFHKRQPNGCVHVLSRPGSGAEAHLQGISALEDPEAGAPCYHSGEQTIERNQLS